MAGALSHDKKLSAEVRRMGLEKIKKLFEMPVVEMSDREKQMHDELLYRMAPNLLPRLNEHSGPDGGPIETKQITGMVIQPDGDSNAGQNNIQDTKPEANTGS